MKLWRISQNANKDYDTYDSAVVAAETERAAQETYPGRTQHESWPERAGFGWAHPMYVTVEYLGEAREGTPAGVILASFNAG